MANMYQAHPRPYIEKPMLLSILDNRNEID